MTISSVGDQWLIEFDHVGGLFRGGVFYRLTDNPTAMVNEHNSVMYLCAGSELEGPSLNVHLLDCFSFGGYLLGQDPDGHSAWNLIDVEVEHFLIEIRIDDEDVVGSTLNERAQVAVKIVFFARLIQTFNCFFRR